jgi:TatA/E family protein of Tat protein translocase
MISLPRGSELIIILFLALLLFGRGRIGSVFSELGKGLREFSQAIKGEPSNKTDEEDKEEPSSDQKS